MPRYYFRPGHPKASERGFVSEADLGDYEAPRAVDAPILSGRFYENQKTVEGHDIGSRRKHQDYMRERGLAPASDYTPGWYEKKRAEQKREADKARRDKIARIVYSKT